MKAIHLNVASKPYHDFGPTYTVAIAVAVLTGLLMVNNGQAAYRYLIETKETREEIARIQAETAREEQRARQVEASVASIDVKQLTAETKYINAQIVDRAFSWSQLLDDLEQVVPRDVRLTSLNPALEEKTGLIRLAIQARGKNHDGLVTMLRKLQANPKFQDAFPTSESRIEDGTYIYIISAMYKPEGRVLRGVLQ